MKKLLLSLGIGLLSCISFGYCYTTVNCGQNFQSQGDLVCVYNYQGQYLYFTDSNWNTLLSCDSNCKISNDGVCFPTTNGSYYSVQCATSFVDIDFLSVGSSIPAVFTVRLADLGNNSINDLQFYLSPGSTDIYKVSYASSVSASFGQNSVSFSSNVSCLSCESSLASCQSDYSSCYSSLSSCQSDYSSCDSSLSSCQSDLNSASGYVSNLEGELNQCTNDLINCSSSSNTGSCESGNNWSALYINDIQHLGKPNIFITIPEEINWDYTSEGDDFDLDIVGYNVDTEYIEGVINKQNYIPTTEDLTEVFSNLGSFGGLLVVCLFVILIFYMFKKIFS